MDGRRSTRLASATKPAVDQLGPAARAGRNRWKTAFGLAAHAGRMSAKAMPMLWRNGVRDTGRRASAHLAGFAQVLQWEFHRWRLQQRVSSHK